MDGQVLNRYSHMRSLTVSQSFLPCSCLKHLLLTLCTHLPVFCILLIITVRRPLWVRKDALHLSLSHADAGARMVEARQVYAGCWLLPGPLRLHKGSLPILSILQTTASAFLAGSQDRSNSRLRYQLC